MFEKCSCGTGGKNTGVPSCVPQINRVGMIAIVHTRNAAGELNSIKESDFVDGILPEAFIDAKLNAEDPSERWFLTPKINSVTDVRAEPITFDVDGIPKIIDQGVRTFLGSYYGSAASPQFAGVLNSFNCIEVSEFEFSVDGAIVGIDAGDEMLPIAIETQTLYAGVVKRTKAELNSVSLTFAIQELVRDEDLIQISASSIEGNILTKKGLIDGTGEALASPAITTSTVRIDMKYIYGDFPSKQAFKGLVVGDLSPDNGVTTSTIYNTTDSANVAVSLMTPVVGSDGVYDLTFAVQPAAKTITVDFSKTGFDFTPFTFVTP